MNADTVMSHIGLGWLVIGYLLFVAVFYAYTWWHGHRVEDRTDGQVGFKVVIYTLLIMSLLLLTHGLQHGLAVAVSDEPIEGVRYGLPALLGGGVPALVLAFAFERRSNRDEFPRARRFALGALALIAGFLAALALVDVMAIIEWSPSGEGGDREPRRLRLWQSAATALSYALLGCITLHRLGVLSRSRPE